MALFELHDGDLVPARLGHEAGDPVKREALDAVRLHIVEVLSAPLFPVCWNDAGTVLTALDPAGQVVAVEVIEELNPAVIVSSMAHLSTVASAGWADLAKRYPGGLQTFRDDWNEFREAMPAKVDPGPRLIIVTARVSESVRASLGLLSASGVELQLLSVREFASGRRLVDLERVDPQVVSHSARLLATRRAARPALDGVTAVVSEEPGTGTPAGGAATKSGGRPGGATSPRGGGQKRPGDDGKARDGSVDVTLDAPTVTHVSDKDASSDAGKDADLAGVKGAKPKGAPQNAGAPQEAEAKSPQAPADAAPEQAPAPDKAPAAGGGQDAPAPKDAPAPDEAPAAEGEPPAAEDGEPAREGQHVSAAPDNPAQAGGQEAPGGFSAQEAQEALARVSSVLERDTAVVWQRLRRGIFHEAVLSPTGVLKLADGRVFTDPNAAADAAQGTQGTDGWRAWRFGVRGPSLQEALDEVLAAPVGASTSAGGGGSATKGGATRRSRR